MTTAKLAQSSPPLTVLSRYAHWMDHFGLVSCSGCNDIVPTHSFTTHRRNKHTGKLFKCGYCDAHFAVQHKALEHEMAGR